MTLMPRKSYLVLANVILLLIILPSKIVISAEITTHMSDPGSIKSIVIEGQIEKGDYDRFIQLVKKSKREIINVYIFSHGGNFTESIKIGRAIRKLELTTVVPFQNEDGRPLCRLMKSDTFRKFLPIPKEDTNCICASSCFFIFVGGVNRVGEHIVVHRPYFEKNEFGKLSKDEAEKEFDVLQKLAIEYMLEMGVPKHIQDEILGTPSEKAIKLDDNTVKFYFHGDIPYRHEWLQAKCGEVKDDEKIRDCYVSVNEERRRAAYEKFFDETKY